jgi:hypothetical protein
VARWLLLVPVLLLLLLVVSMLRLGVLLKLLELMVRELLRVMTAWLKR